jgi:hypothetical protein
MTSHFPVIRPLRTVEINSMRIHITRYLKHKRTRDINYFSLHKYQKENPEPRENLISNATRRRIWRTKTM